MDAAAFSNPYFRDKNNNACFTIAKNGQATDLTFGRQSKLEAYTCRDLADNSWEVAVLNWGGRKHGNISAMGDSGAAILNAEGKLVSILHSGMSRGISNHVTFGTPGHYVEQLIKEQCWFIRVEIRTKYKAGTKSVRSDLIFYGRAGKTGPLK